MDVAVTFLSLLLVIFRSDFLLVGCLQFWGFCRMKRYCLFFLQGEKLPPSDHEKLGSACIGAFRDTGP